MNNPLCLGIAGLGTVGAGVVKILQENGDIISRRAGRDIRISAVSARDRSKDRGIDISRYGWEDNPVALASRPDVDVLIELVGGEEGPAKESVEAAISSGKHVVTANKAMLAVHGQQMAETAEMAGCILRFEAGRCWRNSRYQGPFRKHGRGQNHSCHGCHERNLQLHPDQDGRDRAAI